MASSLDDICSSIGLPIRPQLANHPIGIAILDSTINCDTRTSTESPPHGLCMLQIIEGLLNRANVLFEVFPYNVCSESACYWADVEKALQHIVHSNVRVVLMSLGGLLQELQQGIVENRVIDTLASEGKLIVSAMSNSGLYVHTYPACYRNVFPVAAADSYGRRLASSSYCMDVLQRGALAPGSTELEIGGALSPIEGTSVAAAITAASAAVLMSCRPHRNSAEIKYALSRSTRVAPGTQRTLNIFQALRFTN